MGSNFQSFLLLFAVAIFHLNKATPSGGTIFDGTGPRLLGCCNEIRVSGATGSYARWNGDYAVDDIRDNKPQYKKPSYNLYWNTGSGGKWRIWDGSPDYVGGRVYHDSCTTLCPNQCTQDWYIHHVDGSTLTGNSIKVECADATTNPATTTTTTWTTTTSAVATSMDLTTSTAPTAISTTTKITTGSGRVTPTGNGAAPLMLNFSVGASLGIITLAMKWIFF